MRRRDGSDLVVISQLPPPVHGSTLMTKALLRTLDTLGIRWRLVDRRFSRTVGEVGRFRVGKVLGGLGLVARLVRALTRRRPRVVIFLATTRTFSFAVDWALSEVLRFFRAPVVLYLHTVGYSALANRGGVLLFMVRRLLGSAKTVVVLGEALAGDVRQFARGDIRTIGNTLPDPPPHHGAPLPARQRNIVLFLSNLIPGKGHEDFLAAAVSCLNSGTDTRFVIAGAANSSVERDLRAAIIASGHETRIEYVGAVGPEAKWELLRRSRVLVFPGRSEAFGLVLLEALASGVPIIGYRTGALAPVIEAAGAGRIVDVGDRTALTDELAELLRSEELTDRMSAAALALYKNALSPEQYTAAWAKTLDDFGYKSANRASEVRLPRVAIIQPTVPAYRAPFFTRLIERAGAEGIHIDVFSGEVPPETRQRGDTASVSFVERLPTKALRFGSRTLLLKSVGPVLRGGYDLVVVEQAVRNLETYVLLTRFGSHRLAFWGHGRTFTKRIPFWQDQLKHWLTRRGTWFFGYTDESVDAIVARGYPPDRATVVNNSFDTRELADAISETDDCAVAEFRRSHDLRGRTALYIGGIDTYKRIPFLLEAAESVHRLDSQFRLLIGGDGAERHLVANAESRHPWLHYLGRVGVREKALALHSAEAIAIPGAIGLVALDSLVAGVPIVTTDSAMHGPEFGYLRPEVTAVVSTSEDYAKSLAGFLADDETRKRMAAKCRDDAQQYGIEQMVARYLSGLHAALDSLSRP